MVEVIFFRQLEKFTTKKLYITPVPLLHLINDRSERHEFLSRFLLIYSTFLMLSFFKKGREKGKRIAKVVVEIHAFQTGPY